MSFVFSSKIFNKNIYLKNRFVILNTSYMDEMAFTTYK